MKFRSMASPVASSSLGQNTSLSARSSNTLSLFSSLNIRDHVSYDLELQTKLQFYISECLYSQTARGKTKHSRLNGSRHSLNLISSKFLNCDPSRREI
jgi:hypothetical protein